MRDILKVANECIEELNTIGIYPNIVVNRENVKFTKQYKSWGKCKTTYYTNSGCMVHRITISHRLNDNDLPESSLRSVMFHELLHACDECFRDKHDGHWKKYAELVSDCYNVPIRKSDSFEGLQVKKRDERKTYQCQCTHCGKILTTLGYRAPKWYNNSQNFYHKCNDGSRGNVVVLR